ncbi:MAG: hypothetical protein J0M16_00435 [Gammaproteobacteria bacterium]|nr:hypothetical protein [Gammaproteobacteria bacterium]
MAGKSVTEREVVEWFLDRVNQGEGVDDWPAAIDRAIAVRKDRAEWRDFAMEIAPTLSTATGAVRTRSVLSPTSWGVMTTTHVLDGWDAERAGPGTERYAMQLILDEARPYGAHLGKCQVCDLYFLAPERTGPGSKATEYCSESCREVGKTKKTLERVKAHRARMKQATRKPR